MNGLRTKMQKDVDDAGLAASWRIKKDEEKNKKARVSLAKSTAVFFQSPLIMEKCTQVVLESEFTVFKEPHQEKSLDAVQSVWQGTSGHQTTGAAMFAGEWLSGWNGMSCNKYGISLAALFYLNASLAFGIFLCFG